MPVVRLLLGWLFGFGHTTDLKLYERYASSWSGGQVPYVDFSPEYPPGALWTFLAPLVVGGHRHYRTAFALEMLLFDCGTLALILAWTRRASPNDSAARWFALLGYFGFSMAVYPILLTRFDLVPAFLVLAALYAAHWLDRGRTSALLLGVAGGVKLWPLALTPLWMARENRRSGPAGVLRAALGVATGLTVTFVPFVPGAGIKVLDFLKYHAARGIQIESTWATLALTCNALGLSTELPRRSYGAWHVEGPVSAAMALLSVPALLALCLIPQFVAARALSKPSEARDHRSIEFHAATASVLGFTLGSKVLSPQFMLWSAPLLAILLASYVPPTTRQRLLAIAAAAFVCTTLVFPVLIRALELRAPGHALALCVLATRNASLIALYAYCLRYLTAPAGSPRSASLS